VKTEGKQYFENYILFLFYILRTKVLLNERYPSLYIRTKLVRFSEFLFSRSSFTA